MMRRMLVALLILLSPSLVFAQDKAKAKQPAERPRPSVADFVYGKDSQRQKFDFWRAESERPTALVLLIHGGGWRGGR